MSLFKSGLWSSVQTISGQLLGTVIFLVLGRIVDPAAFGLVAACQATILIFQAVAGFGSIQLVVQSAEVSQLRLSTIFWLTQGASLAVFLLAATVLFALNNMGRVDKAFLELYLLLALTLPIAAAYSVQQGLLYRDMDFRVLATRTIVAQAAGGITGITAAVLGGGAWSLAIYRLTVLLVEMVVVLRATRWVPSFLFDRGVLGEIAPKGCSVMGVQLVGMAEARAMELAIGLLLGPAQLAYYVMATRAFDALAQLSLRPLNSITLPHVSSAVNEGRPAAPIYLGITKWMTAITIPVYLYVLLIAGPLIELLLGPKWHMTATILSIFCLHCLACSWAYLYEPIFTAFGKFRSLWRARLIQAGCGLSGGLAGLAPGGLVTAAVGQVAGLLVSAIWINLLMHRDTGLPTGQGMKMSIPVVLCAGFALAMAWFGMLLSQRLGLFQYAMGTAIYWACVLTTIGLAGPVKPLQQLRAFTLRRPFRRF